MDIKQWRNWHDIQCSWESASSIIDHWADYSADLIAAAGPGHWNDPDMLLIGSNKSGTQTPCLTDEEERTQMAIWSLTASPLIMGNDARSIKPRCARRAASSHDAHHAPLAMCRVPCERCTRCTRCTS